MKRSFAILILIITIPTAAHAWTKASDQRIAKKAATLAPPDMKLVIERFDGDYQKGLARAQADEGSVAHHYFVLSRSGQLRDRIELESNGIVKMIRANEPMSLVVERLGLLAHLVADANNPFHVSNGDTKIDLMRNDFEQYFERRMSKFPTVFYGLDANFRIGSYLDRTFTRTSRFYPLMGEEYFRFGEERTSSEFDDRSTAFGVASVCYSHAVTDLVNLYYYIWREAGGDVRSAGAMRRGNLTTLQ